MSPLLEVLALAAAALASVAAVFEVSARRRAQQLLRAFPQFVMGGAIVNEAHLLIAMVSAIFEGINTWFLLKDRRAAKKARDAAYQQAIANPAIAARAQLLLRIVPVATWDRLRKRVQKCFDKLQDLLDDEDRYFPEDINKAGKVALPRCVCEALDLLRSVNGGDLPDDEFKEAWAKYNCEIVLSAKTRAA